MILLLAAIVVQPAPAADDPPPGDDIVVVAAQQKCRVRFADREMTDGEFKRRAAEWAAGRPVRVIARQNTDLKCLTKIAFRLADRGVRRIRFVEPKDLVGAAPRP